MASILGMRLGRNAMPHSESGGKVMCATETILCVAEQEKIKGCDRDNKYKF